MTAEVGPGAGAFVAAATSLVLHRGGMTVCGDLLAALDRAMAGKPVVDGKGEAISAAQRAVGAWKEADTVAFDAAKDALWRAMAVWWAADALRAERSA